MINQQQQKKEQKDQNHLQNIPQKTKNWATQTPKKRKKPKDMGVPEG